MSRSGTVKVLHPVGDSSGVLFAATVAIPNLACGSDEQLRTTIDQTLAELRAELRRAMVDFYEIRP
jgi:hypothetical protein